MPVLPALSAAADLLRSPTRIRLARSVPLPEGIETLLRIVAGDEEATSEAVAALGRDAETVRRAAEFFVEQVLLDPASDHYRVLGAGPDAATSELRRNMALLLRWLHPDIGENSVRSVYAGRVTSAWERLKTAERRQAYDAALRERAEAASARKVHAVASSPGPGRPRPLPPVMGGNESGAGSGVRSRQPTGIFRRLLMTLVPGGRR